MEFKVNILTLRTVNMRILSHLVICILLFSLPIANAISAEVNCYSGKVRIYHGFGHDFEFYADELIAFTEYKTDHVIVVRADCVVMAPIKKEKFRATITEK
jgi:hypothetical protein